MNKKEFLYSREYESDEVGYRITITTTDYSLYTAVKNYAESIFNVKEKVDSADYCAYGERRDTNGDSKY